MTPQDSQLLELINKIQNHQISNLDALFLGISMSLPVSESQKLAIYQWLSTLPLPELSPFSFILLLILGPTILIFFLFLLIRLILWIIRTVVPFVLSHIVKYPYEKKLLQLTFPADTDKSAYATEELYRLLHTLSRQLSFWDSVIKHKNEFSLEIVSTKKEGIRYLLAAHPKFTDIISRSLLSYLPGIKVSEVDDYLDSDFNKDLNKKSIEIIELKLSSHFALPLETQKTLSENDPISYFTGNMTKLLSQELISCQVIASPVIASFQGSVASEIRNLRSRIYKGQPLTEAVQKNALIKFLSLPGISIFFLFLKIIWKVASFIFMFVFSMVMGVIDTSGKSVPFLMAPASTVVSPQEILNPYEKELSQIIKTKIDQQLFETSIRLLVISTNQSEAVTRLNGLLASLGALGSPYQSFTLKHSFFQSLKHDLNLFKLRQLSQNTSLNPNPILSTSEISDLYHFPYTDTTKTEDMAKVHSKDLPAPLSVKNNESFDVVFGKNCYGNAETNIGLTDVGFSVAITIFTKNYIKAFVIFDRQGSW